MPSYERETTVQAPLEDVWEFHSRVNGLEAVTPAWMGLRVERVIGPDGEPDPELLEAGSEIDLSMRPFGVGPRQHWTSIITERERTDGSAYFRDEMVHGPFGRWVHTHSFYAAGEETVVRDHVDYELPLVQRLGGLADATAPFSQAGFEAMFRNRHRATKAHFE
ncbi:SRPBCC family protein [Halosolutus amylolyticus]|uniref:SRPBCC family protein n=1 Tax=Halosolutus amylolyticus TaxID=2932267 RepID=A0ABD5PVB8_9EURY|nr:SRPBCC family protein [Halosolutus amylolyticus]